VQKQVTDILPPSKISAGCRSVLSYDFGEDFY